MRSSTVGTNKKILVPPEKVGLTAPRNYQIRVHLDTIQGGSGTSELPAIPNRRFH